MSIKLKKSAEPSKVPVSSDLEYGELAINYADGKLYYKRVDNTIQTIATPNNLTIASPLTGGSFNGSAPATIGLPTANSTVTGALSSTDWATFNAKQAALSGAGIVKSTNGTISYLTDNSAEWQAAYNRRITDILVTGAETKTISLLRADSTTVETTWQLDTITVAGDASGSGKTSINLTLANTSVTPGVYGNSTTVARLTVDSKGRVTNAEDVPIAQQWKLEWQYLSSQWSVEPVQVGTVAVSGASGVVYSYTLNGTTRYRFVPDNYLATLDGFYTSYTSNVLGGLICTRG